MALTTYTTIEGERWSDIAFKAYGNALLYPQIIAANPLIGITDTLEGGLLLDIPVLEIAPTQYLEKPFWKK